MGITLRSARIWALAALALPVLAKPVVTGPLPRLVHWPVGTWLSVAVAAEGSGALAYQWYKGPGAALKRPDRSPCRLAGQVHDALAMDCMAHGGGEYWVEITDTADHQSILEGPMVLVPCYRVDAQGSRVEGPAGAGTRLKPVATCQEEEWSAMWHGLGFRFPAGGTPRLVVHPGSNLPVGSAAQAAPAPSAGRMESKAVAAPATVEPLSADLFDDLPDLVDAPWLP